jgi:excisionase family DNA binding protein
MTDFETTFKSMLKEAMAESVKELMKGMAAPPEKVYPEYMNQKLACEYLGMNRSYLYQKAARKEIPVYKYGNRNFFKKIELNAWIESNRIRPASEYKPLPIRK